jgi:hypothetical protein
VIPGRGAGGEEYGEKEGEEREKIEARRKKKAAEISRSTGHTATRHQ